MGTNRSQADQASEQSFDDLARLAHRVAYRLVGSRSEAREHRLPVLDATHARMAVLDLAPSSDAALRAFRTGAEPSGDGSLPTVPGQPNRLVLPELC